MRVALIQATLIAATTLGTGSLVVAQDNIQNQELSPIHQRIAQKLLEGHLEIARQELHLKSLKESLILDRKESVKGRESFYVTIPENLVEPAQILGAYAAFAGTVGTVGVATKKLSAMRGKVVYTPMMALTDLLISLGYFTVGAEVFTASAHGQGLVLRLDSEQAKQLLAAIADAEKELKVTKHRLEKQEDLYQRELAYLASKVEQTSSDEETSLTHSKTQHLESSPTKK